MEREDYVLREVKNQIETLCGGKIKILPQLNGDLKIRRVYRSTYAGRPYKETFSIVVGSAELDKVTIEDLRDVFWHAFQSYMQE